MKDHLTLVIAAQNGGTARFLPEPLHRSTWLRFIRRRPMSIAGSAWIGWVWVVARGDLVHIAGERPGRRWQDPARPDAPCPAVECGVAFSPDVDSV